MPEPIPVDRNLEPFAALRYQFHQVAIYTQDQDWALRTYGQMGGFRSWVHDSAELKGILYDKHVVTKAKMAFAYGIMPMELEFLTYDGPSGHLHEGRILDNGIPFISHMSSYVDDIRTTVSNIRYEIDRIPYHRFITQNHTNPAVAGKKRFIEAIYDTRSSLGYDLKFIQKVPHDFDDSIWLDFQV